MKKQVTAFICIIVFNFEAIFASTDFSFKRYQVEDGLSHNTTWCSIQDSYGFLWIGTSDGMNCYDGCGNRVYRNALNNKYSLGNNFVSSLLEEGENIWVGTNSGLYIYDRSTDRFSYFNETTRYGVFVSSEVKKIIKTQSGLIWIATLGQGVFIYEPVTGVLTQNSIHTSFVWDICQSADSRIYVSSMQEGLFCFDEKGTFLQNYPVLSDSNIGSQRINCLYSIKNEIWFGVGTNLLGCYQEGSPDLKIYDASAQNFGAILCLLDYNEKELLVGTDNGLYLFNRDLKTFRRGDSPFGLRALGDPTVNAMMWDAEGTLWVMTNSGGVSYMTKQLKRFDYYSLISLSGTLELGREIGPLCEDQNGNIWVGTRNGLCLFNTQIHSLSEYTLKNVDARYNIRSLLLDGDRLWIGTYAEGLHVLNLKTGAVKSYVHSRDIPYTICSNDVLSLFKDRKGDVFVGTSWGLCRYNSQLDNFVTIIHVGSMASVTDIYEDMYNNLWVATSNSGVFRYNTVNDRWEHFEHIREDTTTITSNSVITLFEDMKGTMWFGTNGGGLCSFSKDTETFIDFDPENTLLPNKVIFSIEQDRTGDFWISCNAGLCRINPVSQKNFHLFTVNDGLQGNQFTAQSSLRSSTGKFYFGGINGFNVFEPGQFTDNTYLPPVYVTDISFPYLADEQEVKRLLRLDKPFYKADKIQLPYTNNSFTVRFVALSYEDPHRNRYTYMLKGIDKEWIHSSNNTASYTNLPAGEYEFLVCGSNNDHHWNEKAASLWIVITPPWWRTSVAYFMYILLFLCTACYIGWRWNLYVKRKYKRRMEDYQVAKEKEMYKSKINFFINLVHEIRTPLSLIRLPLEKLREEEKEERKEKYLSVMDKNVNYLLGITNQLLDFQKMESGALQLSMKECSINALVSDIFNLFNGSVDLQGLTICLSLPPEEISVMIDSEKVSKILVNLVGNAIKYAKSQVEMRLILLGDRVNIIVSDDGPGVPEGQQNKIFQAFYQLPDDPVATSTGTGIGLVFAKSLAEAHHGTLSLENRMEGGSSFILSLPLETVVMESIPNEFAEMQMIDVEGKKMPDSEFGNKRFIVLLVEDNVELLNLTRESLSDWFKVFSACNGKEALEILSRESIDVIVSDIMMPEMNGLELCNYIKSDLVYSHIPVILLTAKTTLDSKAEGFENGADAYIEKPFSIKQLHKQIENLLKLRLAFHKLMINLSGSPTSSLADFALSQKDVEFIERVNTILSELLADESCSIDLLAEQMNMSRSNFSRKIKALSGMPPHDYIKNFRLNKSTELIMSGIRIAEVAEQLGFTTSSYFAKCFKEKFGVLPKDYKG